MMQDYIEHRNQNGDLHHSSRFDGYELEYFDKDGDKSQVKIHFSKDELKRIKECRNYFN